MNPHTGVGKDTTAPGMDRGMPVENNVEEDGIDVPGKAMLAQVGTAIEHENYNNVEPGKTDGMKVGNPSQTCILRAGEVNLL